MVIGTAFGWGNLETVVLSIVLAFCFGYSLTMLPLLRGELALAAAVPLALASDTLSIAGVVAFPVNRWLIARGKGPRGVYQHSHG